MLDREFQRRRNNGYRRCSPLVAEGHFLPYTGCSHTHSVNIQHGEFRQGVGLSGHSGHCAGMGATSRTGLLCDHRVAMGSRQDVWMGIANLGSGSDLLPLVRDYLPCAGAPKGLLGLFWSEFTISPYAPNAVIAHLFLRLLVWFYGTMSCHLKVRYCYRIALLDERVVWGRSVG